MNDPGYFVNRDGAVLKYYGECPEPIIPEGTVEIGEGMMDNNAHAARITIPEGVKKIGARAFRNCTKLTHIHIPDTVTEIGDEAFRRCESLKQIRLPEGKLRIGRGAFRGCKGLADKDGFVIVRNVLHCYCGESDALVIPDAVKKIDPSVFADNPYVAELRLPEGMTEIGDEVFRFCEDLTKITVPDSVVRFGRQAFRFCKGLADQNGFVIVKNRLWSYFGPGGAVTVPEGVTSIEEAAFYGNTRITSLVIPDSVKKIEEGAFRGCEELSALRLGGGATCIGKDAFSLCQKLTAVSIPKTVHTIGVSAFSQCEALGVLEIAEGVEDIGDYAFSHCKALTSVAVPTSVTCFGVGVFNGCSNLTQMIFPFHIRWAAHQTLNYLNNLQRLVMPGVTPERFMSKTARYAAAVGFLTGSEAYEEPLVAESYRAFIRRNKKAILPLLFKLDSAPGLSVLLSLGKGKPKDFDKDYVQPAQNAGASSCMAYLMDWSNRQLQPEAELDLFMDELMRDPFDPEELRENWSFKKLPDGTMRITGYKGTETQVEFPPRVGKKQVTSIGMHVLATTRKAAGTQIRSVIIPEGVTTIEDGAFLECEHLQTVQLPTSIKTIGKLAFSGCPGLKDAKGFVIFGDTLFGYYGTDPEPVIPEGVRVISEGAFRGRMHLKTVTLPESLEEIGETAFFKCSQLNTVRIPGRVRRIGDSAFSACENLKTVTVDEGVRIIDDSGFSDCGKLTTMTLPASIKGIGLWAFDNCNIMTIHAPAGSYAEAYAQKHGFPFVAED